MIISNVWQLDKNVVVLNVDCVLNISVVNLSFSRKKRYESEISYCFSMKFSYLSFIIVYPEVIIERKDMKMVSGL